MSTERRTTAVVYAIAFLTGAAGLIYEISWSRQLGLLFGHTAQAAAVVLSSYFAGMALGYGLAGRWAARSIHPLRGYAFAELGVAGWGAVLPSVLSAFDGSVLAAVANSENPTIQLLSRALLSFIVLLPGTVGLGATLPFIAQSLGRGDPAASRVNLAYALNIAGGVVGVVLATAVLLVVVGVKSSGYVAAGISALCGAIAWVVGGRAMTATHSGQAANRAPETGRARPWLVLAAVSGCGVLALEVLYARLFALVFHNSTYTFGLVLTGCLLALAAGAASARFVSHARGPHQAVVEVCLLMAAAIPTSVIVFVAVTRLRYFTCGEGLAAYLWGAFGLVLLVVFPAMTLAGMLLPLVWRAGWGPSGPGAVVGRLTAVNSLAASLGALVTGFLVLPALGLWGAFTLVAMVYFVVWLAGAWPGPRVRRWATALLVTTVVILGSIAPQGIPTVQPGQELLRHWDSAYGWVEVIRDPASGHVWIRRDAQHVLGSTEDHLQEARQAVIPLLLHPKPSSVLFVGMGTGITAGAALVDPLVEDVTVVELIPEVVDAARLFSRFNWSVLDNPRAAIVINDGRHFLAATDRHFDVIVSDIFVPWESQTGYLYTVEHYRAARSRLAPGGLCCQWLPTWQLRESDLAMIADSFATVFPEVDVWFAELRPGFLVAALVGSEQKLSIDPGVVASRVHRFVAIPGAASTGAELLNLYVGHWTGKEARILNTDEHPRIEFMAPRTQFERDRVLVSRAQVMQALSRRVTRVDARDHGQGSVEFRTRGPDAPSPAEPTSAPLTTTRYQ